MQDLYYISASDSFSSLQINKDNNTVDYLYGLSSLSASYSDRNYYAMSGSTVLAVYSMDGTNVYYNNPPKTSDLISGFTTSSYYPTTISWYFDMPENTFSVSQMSASFFYVSSSAKIYATQSTTSNQGAFNINNTGSYYIYASSTGTYGVYLIINDLTNNVTSLLKSGSNTPVSCSFAFSSSTSYQIITSFLKTL